MLQNAYSYRAHYHNRQLNIIILQEQFKIHNYLYRLNSKLFSASSGTTVRRPTLCLHIKYNSSKRCLTLNMLYEKAGSKQ